MSAMGGKWTPSGLPSTSSHRPRQLHQFVIEELQLGADGIAGQHMAAVQNLASQEGGELVAGMLQLGPVEILAAA